MCFSELMRYLQYVGNSEKPSFHFLKWMQLASVSTHEWAVQETMCRLLLLYIYVMCFAVCIYLFPAACSVLLALFGHANPAPQPSFLLVQQWPSDPMNLFGPAFLDRHWFFGSEQQTKRRSVSQASSVRRLKHQILERQTWTGTSTSFRKVRTYGPHIFFIFLINYVQFIT